MRQTHRRRILDATHATPLAVGTLASGGRGPVSPLFWRDSCIHEQEEKVSGRAAASADGLAALAEWPEAGAEAGDGCAVQKVRLWP